MLETDFVTALTAGGRRSLVMGASSGKIIFNVSYTLTNPDILIFHSISHSFWYSGFHFGCLEQQFCCLLCWDSSTTNANCPWTKHSWSRKSIYWHTWPWWQCHSRFICWHQIWKWYNYWHFFHFLFLLTFVRPFSACQSLVSSDSGYGSIQSSRMTKYWDNKISCDWVVVGKPSTKIGLSFKNNEVR